MLQLGRHSPSVASGMIVYGQLLASFMILICGLRVDASKIDEDRWLRRSVLLVMVFALPITLMQSSASVFWLFLGQTLYGLVNGTLSSVVMTYVSRCFPVTCRYSGVSTCWSVSAAIFGGSALLVGEILFQRELGLLIGVYVALSLPRAVCHSRECVLLQVSDQARILPDYWGPRKGFTSPCGLQHFPIHPLAWSHDLRGACDLEVWELSLHLFCSQWSSQDKPHLEEVEPLLEAVQAVQASRTGPTRYRC